MDSKWSPQSENQRLCNLRLQHAEADTVCRLKVRTIHDAINQSFESLHAEVPVYEEQIWIVN